MKIKHFISTIIYAGTSSFSRYDPRRGVCIGVNLLSLCIILINLTVGSFFSFATSDVNVFFGSIIEAALVGFFIYANHIKRHTIANLGFYLTLNGATFYFGSILGKTADVELMIVFLIALSLFMFEGKLAQIASIFVSLALFALLEFNYKYQFIKRLPISLEQEDSIRWVATSVVISLVILIIYLYKKNMGILIQLYTHSKKVENSLVNEEELNKTKSLFIRQAYHEVKGGFFGITSIIEVLKTEVKNHDTHSNIKELVSQLGNAKDNYIEMMQNVLQFSQIGTPAFNTLQLDIVNIRRLMIGFEADHQPFARNRKIGLQLFIDENVPNFVFADKIKLNQISTNLLTNAIKFSDENSTITIRLKESANFIELSVEDQGIGIPNSLLERVFEPFFMVTDMHRNSHGSGLGLSITKNLVEIMGGRIQLDSTVGVGSRFTVYIPALYEMPAEQ